MSREVRRVPLDFDHPIGETWPGYLRTCADDDCDGCAACESVDPPEGEGWQLWETTSEGSPISPVFISGDGLVAWMSTNPCGFAGRPISIETAQSWVFGVGWSPSMIAIGGQLMDGITGVVQMKSGGGSDE